MAVSSYRIQIFLTCWISFALHFATGFVREHYLVLSIGDNFSFQLTGYEGLHDDIFTSEEHGTHHGANRGASLVAVLPNLLGLVLRMEKSGFVTAGGESLWYAGGPVAHGGYYPPFLEGRRASAQPFMALAAALVYGVWRIGAPRAGLVESQESI